MFTRRENLIKHFIFIFSLDKEYLLTHLRFHSNSILEFVSSDELPYCQRKISTEDSCLCGKCEKKYHHLCVES